MPPALSGQLAHREANSLGQSLTLQRPVYHGVVYLATHQHRLTCGARALRSKLLLEGTFPKYPVCGPFQLESNVMWNLSQDQGMGLLVPP